MAASVWFAVTTRGLEMILPLPSDSRALSSKFRKRVMPALNSDKANDPGCAFGVVRRGCGRSGGDPRDRREQRLSRDPAGVDGIAARCQAAALDRVQSVDPQ